ncbi:hypothetical protein CEP53_009834 [Fusarium sp. AF-6]|nr:hypothetical protein CEP53_009834 [Fusarium sp. AF-6]
MRPRTVVRRQENKPDGKNDEIKKEEEKRSDEKETEREKVEKKKKEEKIEEEKEEKEKEGEEKIEEEKVEDEKANEEKEEEKNKGEESGEAKNEAWSEEDRQQQNDPDFGAASATYMPYFCFSTQYRDETSLSEKQKKFNAMKTTYEGLKDSKSPVIHESPTLDEWYYQFATDEKSTKDRKSRNRTQIVTKALEGRKGTEEDDEALEESDRSTKEGEENEPEKWTLLRINQVWAWTISDKWLITASSCLFDGSNGTLVEGILEQLAKEVEAGGSASQPESAVDMCRFVVDYCIGTYERLPKNEEPNPGEPKPQGQGSIRQIFSNTINEIGREEAVLFDKFRKQTKRWRGQIPGERKKSTEEVPSPEVSSDKTSEALSQDSTYRHIRAAIKKAEEMYCEIKDIRDELNILKSAAQHQRTVEEGLTGGSLDVDLAAAYIVKDLREMDNSAERIQSAINTTLSLLQSESANLQATLSLEQSELSNRLADLARRQGKTLMVFTIVTILFLPLSFLSSLFALDVASFLQAPGWAFAVIFAVSFAFSAVTALVAQRWEKFSPYMRPLRKFILHPWKSTVQVWESIKVGSKSSEEKNVPQTPPGPATGKIESFHAPRGVAVECIYENSPASASYLSALEQRLQRLEERQDVESRPSQQVERRVSRNESIRDASVASREMQASPGTQGPYSPNTSRYASNVDGLATVSTTTESECMYGPSSTIAFVQFCNEANRQGSLPETEQQVDDQPSAAVPEAIREKDPFAAAYPPRRTADDFVRCFWEFVHPVFPVLHKTSFMSRYNLLWSAEDNESSNDAMSEMDEVIFSSTLNIVFAVGCRFSESVPAANRASLAQTFYQRSRSIYRFEILDSMSLSAIQMLLLTGVYLQSTQQATRCWNVVGLAIRAAQSLGLHVESPNQPRSQLSREMRRRVWHTCLVLDKLLSMTFGRPAMISTSWHVPLPSLIDDEYLSADGEGEQPQDKPSRMGLLIWSSKLFLILDEILLSFYAPHPQKSVDTMSENDLNVQQIISDVMVLNRRIEEFFDSIPGYLRLQPGSEFTAEQQELSVTIQKQILNCR